jgi:hypothetical protein
MTETPTPQPTPPPEQLPWGISYLREDIQDLRQEMRGLDAKLEARTTSLYTEIKALDLRLNAKIDSLGTHLHTRIDQVYTRLDAKIDTKFYWTLGTVLLTWASTMLAVLFK